LEKLKTIYEKGDKASPKIIESPLKMANGYFSYYFPTDELRRFPKRIVFVLDVSGSMDGRKIDQTKNSVIRILDSLDEYVNNF
jgi:hypothetical protein